MPGVFCPYDRSQSWDVTYSDDDVVVAVFVVGGDDDVRF